VSVTSAPDVKAPVAKGPLQSQLAKIDPTLRLAPVEAKAAPKHSKAAKATAELTKQLDGFTDTSGKSVLTGAIPTSKAKPAANAYASGGAPLAVAPENGKVASAMMAGKNSGVVVETNAPAKFRSIPFFKFSHLGQSSAGLTEKQCQNTCGEDGNCLSFSYNAEKNLCLRSKSCVQYDLEFNFYAKRAKKTEGEATFRHLGAMKYMYTGKSTHATATTGFSKEACKIACAKDEKCHSFTYRQRDKLCLRSSQKLGYETGWTYFEKIGAAAKVSEEAKYGKPVKGSTKALMRMFRGAGSAKLRRKVRSDKASGVSAQDNAALSPSQLAYLAKKTKNDQHRTQAQIMRNALRINERKLDEAQRARIAIAKLAAERAHKIAEYKKTKETKGKELYKTELRSSASSVKDTIEKASKAGWNSREVAKKDEERARERSHKEAIDRAAKKAREITRKKTEEKAQKELELTDAVKAAHARLRVAKEDLAAAKSADKTSAKRIKFLVSEQQRAIKLLAKAGDMTEEQNARASATSAAKTIKGEKTLQQTTNSAIKKEDSKVPKLMKTEQDDSVAIKKYDAKLAAAKLAVKSSDNQSKLAVTEAADSAAKAGLAKSKAGKAHAGEQLKALKVKITKAHSVLSASKDKEDVAMTLKNKMDLKVKELAAWRQKTKDTATVLLNSSKFQEKQEIANERRIKSSLGTKMKAIVAAKEHHKKQEVKLKEYRDRVKELEKKAKEQADEKKLKLAQQSKEKNTKAEQKAADKVKSAKNKEKEGAKMVSAAKLAAATAVTVDQKVKAAQAQSKAQMLKVSGEQKLAAKEPDLQKAKVAEGKAADKVSTDKNLMSSDDAKLKKAAAKDNAAKKAVEKAKAKGPIQVVKQDEAVVVGLAAESAKLSGCNQTANAVDEAKAKSAQLHNKAQEAVKNVKELHTKLQKKRKLAAQESADKAAKEKEQKAPERMHKFIMKQKSRETNVKKYIKDIKNGSAESAKKAHAKIKEMDTKESKTKATNKELSEKKDARNKARQDGKTKRLKAKEQTQELKKETAQANEKAAGSGKGGSGKGDGCSMGDLKTRESCAKSKAKDLLLQEKTQKSNARKRETKIKTLEKEEKTRQRERKTKEKEKKAKDKERTSKEKGEKEKKQENEKKKEAKRKLEQKAKDAKEKAKKKKDKAAAEEKITKTKEKATKEKTAKESKREKAEKEAKSKGEEKHTKFKEKETKAKAKKTKEKADKEKKTKETKSKENKQKSTEKKGKEKVVKQKESTEKKAAAEKKKKEQSVKKKEQEEKQQKEEKKTKEKKTKTAEKNSKEKAKKKKAQELSSKERSKKKKATEVQSKEQKQKNKANEKGTKAKATKDKANEKKSKADAKQAKADAAANRAANAGG